MDIEELLRLYDIDQRRDICFDGNLREEDGDVIRLTGQNGSYGSIIYTQLNAETADEAIQRQMDYFRGKVKGVEWKLFTHDQPHDLLRRLIVHGFVAEEEEAIMVLEVENAPEKLLQPVTQDIRRITTPAGIKEIITVQSIVEEEDYSWLAAELISVLHAAPDEIGIYGAYVDDPYMDDRVVSSAWIRFPQKSRFASLWGGSTLPEYRKRGLFSALVATRIQEAKKRGYPFVTVDASAMSRPILEKHGFKVITTSFPCLWSAETSDSARRVDL